MPYFNLSGSNLWPITSNALVKSRNMPTVYLVSSKLVVISPVKVKIGVG